MRAEFSEFSYGFALSYEVMNAIEGIAGVPVFPSLRQGEHTASAELTGWPVFLQFKLADWMKGSTAKYRSHYGASYFRVTVPSHIHSSQHNLLRALSAIEPEVYYAAPQFYRRHEFNALFGQNRIFAESVFVPLTGLPDLDDDAEHDMCYLPGEPKVRWHSLEGKAIAVDVSGSAWAERLRQLVCEPRDLGPDYFTGLRALLVDLIHKHTLQPDLFELPVNLDERSPLAVIRDLRYLLITYYGLEPMILYRR
jgi:hypothetical protein